SRRIPKAARTGSSEASSQVPASASRFRSPTWSSTSKPSAKKSADAALLAGDRRDVLRDRGDLRRRELALEGRHDRAAVRDLALHGREARHQVVEVRPDGGARA